MSGSFLNLGFPRVCPEPQLNQHPHVGSRPLLIDKVSTASVKLRILHVGKHSIVAKMWV